VPFALALPEGPAGRIGSGKGKGTGTFADEKRRFERGARRAYRRTVQPPRRRRRQTTKTKNLVVWRLRRLGGFEFPSGDRSKHVSERARRAWHARGQNRAPRDVSAKIRGNCRSKSRPYSQRRSQILHSPALTRVKAVGNTNRVPHVMQTAISSVVVGHPSEKQ
jgi:hypothetical protein